MFSERAWQVLMVTKSGSPLGQVFSLTSKVQRWCMGGYGGRVRLAGKVKSYQNIITTLLGEYASIPPSYPTTLRDELIIDTQRNHFQLITVGWKGSQFVHEAIFHLDIIDESMDSAKQQ